VRCTKISPEFDCQGQRSKVKVTGDKKRKSAALVSAVVLCGAVLCIACRGRSYAGGKISACCLVSQQVVLKRTNKATFCLIMFECNVPGDFFVASNCICGQLLLPFNGHYTGQPALAGVSLAPPVKNWKILLEQSFTARMPLLTATSAFGLVSKR